MGIVFDIQRCSYHDGPGIRTTVFLKGCQLRCAWCHNPESFRFAPQLQFISNLCVHCGTCAGICPNGVHTLQAGIHHVDFSRCTACGACTEICPEGALKILGREMTPQDVISIVLRDKAYYLSSGGGLTVSGGEPTQQPDFLLALLGLAKENGVHTCLETNGYIAASLLDRLAPLVDLFLLDYKLSGSDALYAYTRAAGNLWQHTLDTLESRHIPMILRLPIIPGVNNTKEHFREAAMLKASHACIESIEIMPYHAIGAAKWEQLGYDYSLAGLPSATPEQKAAWQSMLTEQLIASTHFQP